MQTKNKTVSVIETQLTVQTVCEKNKKSDGPTSLRSGITKPSPDNSASHRPSSRSSDSLALLLAPSLAAESAKGNPRPLASSSCPTYSPYLLNAYGVSRTGGGRGGREREGGSLLFARLYGCEDLPLFTQRRISFFQKRQFRYV